MKVKIRSATLEDEAAIKRLLRSLPGVWQNEWRRNAVSIAISSAGELALVAINDKEIVGYMSCHDVGFRAYLSEMAISEKYQKCGIGTLLLEKAGNILRNKGCKLMIADIHPPAEKFYRKNGWIKPHAVLLAKRLETNKG